MNGEAGDPQTYRGGAELSPHVQLCSREEQEAAGSCVGGENVCQGR